MDTGAVAPGGGELFGPARVVRCQCRRCGHTDEWLDPPGAVEDVRRWAGLPAIPDNPPPDAAT